MTPASFLIRLKRLTAAMLIACVAFFQAPAPTLQAKELDFSQAVGTMLNNNQKIKAAEKDLSRAGYEKKAALGLFAPEITLEGKYTRIDQEITLDLNSIRTVILSEHPETPSSLVPSFEKQVQDDTFFKSQVKAVWPIFTGGKILAANRAAEAGVRSAEAGLEETRQVLLADLVKYYFGVRLAEQALAVRKQALDVMTRHLDQARRLEEEGMIAKTERLHAEVACAEAGREFKSASRDLAIAQTGLGNLLNLSEPAYPSSPLFILPAMDPVESFVEEAGEDHPGLKKLHAIGDQAHQQVRAKEAKYFPEIFLFGQRELNTRDLTVLEPKWAVGVGFKVAIFSGLKRPHQALAAKRQEESIRLMESQTRSDLETLVRIRYEELMKAWETFASLDASMENARENLRARTRAFEEGLGASLDVVDAQLSLSADKVMRLQAAYDYDVALARLLEAGGHGERFESYRRRARIEVEK